MSRKILIDALHALEPALQSLTEAVEASGGGIGGGGAGGDGEFILQAGRADQPGGGPKPAKPGGDGDADEEEGGIGGILAAGRSHPVALGIAAIAGLVGPGIGGGIVSAARGGDFGAGALSAVNQQLANVPILGEATGVAQGARVEAAVSGGIAQQIAEVEARGGALTDEQRGFLIGENFEIESRRQESLRQSQREIERQAANGATGQPRLTGRDIAISTIGGLPGILLNQALESVGIELFK